MTAIFKGPIQEIRDFHWLKVLNYGLCTGRYQYHIRSNHNGMSKIGRYVSYRPLYAMLSCVKRCIAS